jgi:hypothetical protein
MSEQPQFMDVFLDLLPNQPKNEQTRESFRQLLRQRFEDTLTDAVERVWDLPSIVVKPQGEYLTLLLEARALYLTGHFYSCVAMCGIVGERLVKDVFRASVLVQQGGAPQSPPEAAFNQLERVEVSGIIRFLKEAGLLNAEATRAAESLGQLRNQYAHARGQSPQPDALKAITLLHTLVEDTVSVFKEFEIKDGIFVHKTTQ